MGAFIPPQNYGMVEQDLYRSAQPNELNFPFLEKLHLRTVIYMTPDQLPPALCVAASPNQLSCKLPHRSRVPLCLPLIRPFVVLNALSLVHPCVHGSIMWLEDQRINLVILGEEVGKRSPWKPVSEETVLEGLHLLLEPANYPMLVMCNLGRHRTGTMIGCLRKLQGWSLTSILDEYRRHAGAKCVLAHAVPEHHAWPLSPLARPPTEPSRHPRRADTASSTSSS